MWSVVLSALVANVCAQEAPVRAHNGYPQDWSDRQIVFSRDTLALHPDLLYREPRVLNQAIERWQVPDWGNFHPDNPPPLPPKKGIHRDWNFPIGNHLRRNMFPAKFSFDPAAPPDCVNDYVVFGLAVAGSATQANLVAFNNLYVDPTGHGNGFCAGTAPNLMFAYNVTTPAGGGQIQTSPVISLDGKKIAFIESTAAGNPGPTIFHVLTWTTGGTIIAPLTPTSASMASQLVSASATDSTSSPWIDYSADSAYMGTDDGNVYQVTGVYHGTLALSGGTWPVMTATNYRLTAPVLDSGLGLLMVGSLNGNLYQINTAAGTLAGLAAIGGGSTSFGIVAPPIVDVTNGTTFVVDADDGASAVLVELDTSSLIPHSTAHIGIGSAGGTKLRLFQPAFSNAYYNDPTTGTVNLCGTGTGTDTSPWQYSFGFPVDRFMSESPETGFPVQLSTDVTDSCTGWTEFYNPLINSGVDFFFFGLTGDCTLLGTSGSTTGCVVALSSDSSIPTASASIDLGPSGIVVDNYSTALQASSIYFTSVGANTAYKFTQDGLQ